MTKFQLKYGRWILKEKRERREPYIRIGRWILLLGDVNGGTRKAESEVKEKQ